MRVKFWGTRGSIATPGAATVTYGGNTSCVELRCGSDILIFDAGTGIRPLGLELMAEFAKEPVTVHLFISHTHWDHIQGFPFFTPAYSPLTTLHVYGSAGQGLPLEKVLRGQMQGDYFPVALGDIEATLHVHEFKGKPFAIGDATVDAMYLNHPGMTLGYRVEHGGKSFVYATDNEPYRHTLKHLGHRAEIGGNFGRDLDREFVKFIAGADFYIGEAQYTDAEYPARLGWGHSSISATVAVAIEAQVGTLAFFHHDPLHDDKAVAAMADTAHDLIKARGATLECFAAREGQVVEL
ncbi:MAG TPA: MBL fold metallo-hydrolase [Burkholderiales bacterium]|nr:MBL fold metallo-hydrolase [Burkholderiales bacterium]